MTYFSDHFPIIFSSDVVFAMTSSRILKAWWTIGRKNIWRNRNSSHSDVTAVKSLSVRFLLWKTTPLGKTCLLCITIHNTNVSCLILHIKQNTKQCFNQIKHWFLQSKHTVIPQIQTQSNSSHRNTNKFITSKDSKHKVIIYIKIQNSKLFLTWNTVIFYIKYNRSLPFRCDAEYKLKAPRLFKCLQCSYSMEKPEAIGKMFQIWPYWDVHHKHNKFFIFVIFMYVYVIAYIHPVYEITTAWSWAVCLSH